MTNRALRNRLARLEKSNPTPTMSAIRALDLVRDFADYATYENFCRYVRITGRDPWTNALQVSWADKASELAGSATASSYIAAYGHGPDLTTLEENEIERCQELIRMPVPMSEDALREFQTLWHRGYPGLELQDAA